MNFQKLVSSAKDLRIKTFKAFIKTGEAHLGGSFSMIEFIVILLKKFIRSNDKFILSKSHASYPLILLLKEKGYNPKLKTHLEIDKKNKIECTTGSLGHGLPIATGIAFSRKLQKKKGKVFVLISDGECQEGTTWESLLIATKQKLDNLIIVVDYNKIQALTSLENGLPLKNLYSKFKSFNCDVISVKNGHSFKNLQKALKRKTRINKPKVIILNTVKGKGIKEFENDPVWHARILKGKEMSIGKKRLGI